MSATTTTNQKSCVITAGALCNNKEIPNYCLLQVKQKNKNQPYDIRVTVNEVDNLSLTKLIRNKELLHIPMERQVEPDDLVFLFTTQMGWFQLTVVKNGVQISILRSCFGEARIIKQQVVDKILHCLTTLTNVDEEEILSTRNILPSLMQIE